MTESPLAELGQRAKAASRVLARTSTAQKNAALLAIANGLDRSQAQILAANAQDVADGQAAGLSPALLDRLLLNEKRLAGMAADTRSVAALPDPVGEEFDGRLMPNGLRIARRRTPLGVLGVIYEARPNVTIDIAALSLKTGNAAILRGGKETLRSNLALIDVIHTALEEAGLPADSILYIDNPDRSLVTELLRLDQSVDMIIPRGGNCPAQALPRASHDPGHDRRHRHLPPVRGHHGRPGQGRRDHPQRQDPAADRVQFARHDPRASRHRSRFPPQGGRPAGRRCAWSCGPIQPQR